MAVMSPFFFHLPLPSWKDAWQCYFLTGLFFSFRLLLSPMQARSLLEMPHTQWSRGILRLHCSTSPLQSRSILRTPLHPPNYLHTLQTTAIFWVISSQRVTDWKHSPVHWMLLPAANYLLQPARCQRSKQLLPPTKIQKRPNRHVHRQP